MNRMIDNTEQVIESKQILKDLHQVLVDAKKKFIDEFIAQEVKLSDTFKVAFRNMLVKKNCTVEYFSYTTVVNNTFGQQIYIANQWFVIASYFVDFCSEMLRDVGGQRDVWYIRIKFMWYVASLTAIGTDT